VERERWLDELRVELKRRYVPRRYARRLMGELSDHFTDLMEDAMNKDVQESSHAVERLGAPGPLAQRAAEEYRRGRFAARHPWLAFVALPPLQVFALWATLVAIAVGVAYALEWLGMPGGPYPIWGKLALTAIFFCVCELPIVWTAARVCRASQRAGLGWRWAVLGCLLVSLAAIQVCPRVGVQRDGTWCAYVGLPYISPAVGYFDSSLGGPSMKFPLVQAIQFSLPMAVAAWLLLKPTRLKRWSGRRLSAG
jgi:hypothetical protein